MKVRLLAAAALLATAIATPAPVSGEDISWRAAPNRQTTLFVYPKLARELLIDGAAQVHCQVSGAGRLEFCTVVDESPPSLGFGRAALRLASFHVPEASSAPPGTSVRLPILFAAPFGAQSAPRPAPLAADDARQVAALAVVDSMGTVGDNLERYREIAREIEAHDGASPEDRAAAATMLVAAAEAAAPRLRQAHAAMWAHRFDAPVLTEIARFHASEAGPVVRGTPAFRAERVALARIQNAIRIDAARRAICARTRCDASEAERSTWLSTAGVDVESPAWIEAPSPGELMGARPALARALAIGGFVQMVCEARPDGRIGGCKVRSEAPAGYGLAAAAASLTGDYVLHPDSRRGRTVALRIAFPAGQAPAPPGDGVYAPQSPEALALARTFVSIGSDTSATAAAASLTRSIALQGRELTSSERSMLDRVGPELAESSARERELAARLYARHFSADQLRGAIAFRRSSASAALGARPFTAEDINIALDPTRRAIAFQARSQFCATRVCIAKSR